MPDYPFSKRGEMLVFCCTHVLERIKPVSLVSHHFDDNNWEFVCCLEHCDADAVIVSVGELLDIDPTLELLSDLEVGYCATRRDKRYKWQLERIGGEKSYPRRS